ncbi:hypothetical protein Fmac_019960 [Flemingia macrophylla]|uniref:Regulator of Vps4 activity in the MVB pathway protein n=1 Tax=Flemingia macrophylla TaxID=520843 RepID=A0ABD1M9B1_9FABA
MIRKKRNAVQKFLKKDIADLLSHGLDYNAYGRAEGLLVEKNVSSCYENISKFASCISGHVRDICKQRDIPDQCKEAIHSLIYAAARFADLPELRELRTLFTGKFGKDIFEPYLCIEFVEKLRQHPPSKEMRFQLLHDISQEFSIEWDSKNLERRLNTPPQLYEEKAKLDLLNDRDGVKWDNNNNDVAIPKIDDMGKRRDGTDTSNGNDGDIPSQSSTEATTYSKKQSAPESGMLRTVLHVHPSLPDYDDLSVLAAVAKADRPHSEATLRVRHNVSYFHVNYYVVVWLTLGMSLLSNPSSLFLLAALLRLWLFLYLLCPTNHVHASPLPANVLRLRDCRSSALSHLSYSSSPRLAPSSSPPSRSPSHSGTVEEESERPMTEELEEVKHMEE